MIVVIGFAIEGTRCHQLVVWSSNEKFALLDSMAAAYRPPAVDRRCVRVIVKRVPSGDAESALARGAQIDGLQPHVWSPAATTWVLLLSQHRKEQGLSEIVPPVRQSLIKSPLVIAMPETMADTLKQSVGAIGWREILDLAQAPEGWGRFGKPWGRFRLAKTNPTVSTSGLHALISTYNAALGKTGPLTLEEVRRSDVRSFVQGVESSVVHYGDSVGAFLESLYQEDERRAALSYVSAIAVEEKQVFDYNRGNPSSGPCTPCPKLPPQEKLVAVYPNGGTLMADHPYVVLNAEWVDAAHREAAVDFLQYLEGEPIHKRFLAEGFRDNAGHADENVLQPPYFDPNEPSAEVTLSQPPVQAEVQASWSDLRKRANIILAFDVGRSMSMEVPGQGVTKLELVKHAVSAAMPNLAADDAVGLWTFSTRPGERPYREVTPLSQLDSGDTIARPVAGLETVTGERQLYATVRASVEYLRSRFATDRINAVVVASDGDDERAGSPELYVLLDYLRAQPEDKRVRVFAIAYDHSARGALTQIAQASKGRFYDASDPLNITEVLRDVVSNF